MHHNLLKRDLIQLDWAVEDRNDFFSRMAAKLVTAGYVADTFLDALTRREEAYPTGLPTRPEAIAIPHADTIHVIEPFIASTRLARPITWHEMVGNGTTHPVRLIFTLGFKKEDGHVDMLQTLLDNVQNPSFTGQLIASRSADEFHRVLSTMTGLEH